jgi:AcrR family transcriptional regulator
VVDIHENFINLKEEKRDAVINAALEEFSSKGYDLASTNGIVKTAEISKGALFHYFLSKKELFLFLCDYVFDVVKREFYDQIGHCRGDLIERYRRAAILKGNVYIRYPRMFDFVKRLTRERSAEIAGELQEKIARITALGYERLLDRLDESLFRDDVPADKVRDLILFAAEGYGNQTAERMHNRNLAEIDMDRLNSEFDEYLDVLRKCFYKS